MALRASVTFSLPLEMNEDLEACGRALNLPISAIVRTLIQVHLEDDPRMKEPDQFRQTYKPGHEYRKRKNGGQ